MKKSEENTLGNNREKPQQKISTESYKGVRDFYPEDQAIQDYIFKTWESVVENYGYNKYNASILEPSELYRAKSGEELVNEQTYQFKDRGDRDVTLRPEMTPTVARMIARMRREIGFPARWYSIPNLFRYERPQRGRLREHWQLNVDVFGISGTDADIEIIEIADAILKKFGATHNDFIIKISSRKLLNAIFADWYEMSEEQSHKMQKLIDRKAKISTEEFDLEAEKIVGKAFKFLNFKNNDEALSIPSILDAKNELDAVISALHSRGIKNVEYDETLIRGFDYYTGIIFEVFDTNEKNNRSLFGGGRYDELMGIFGEEKIPTVGFGMGDVPTIDFLEVHHLLPKYKSTTDIMICIMDSEFNVAATEIATTLRKSGINVAVNYSNKKIGDQIKSADKQSIPNIKRLSDGTEITATTNETDKIKKFLK
jgi:histidyl-tRNA synthetase